MILIAKIATFSKTTSRFKKTEGYVWMISKAAPPMFISYTKIATQPARTIQSYSRSAS